MKKTLINMLLISCLPVVALAGPKISINELQWDYGHVSQHATLSHPYWIRNVGDDTLRNIDVRPG